MGIKRLRWSRYELVALLIIAFAVTLRLILAVYGWPASNSDEGTMGLEAMHIAYRAEHPIYLYGQNYMGVAEAYIGAALFRLFGVSIFTLRLGLILLFTLFLVSLYLLTYLLYSKGLALVSLLVLSLGSSSTLLPELIAGGGLLETLLCGTLLLLLATLLAFSTRVGAGDMVKRGVDPRGRPRTLKDTGGEIPKASVGAPFIAPVGPSQHDDTQFTTSIFKHGEPRVPPWLRQKRYRLLMYGAWGYIAGLGLWSHLLVMPFLLVSGILLFLFCRQELRVKSSLFCLLAGFLLGGFPFIYYNVLNPLQNSLIAFLQADHAIDALAPTGISLYVKAVVSTFVYAVPIMTGFSPTCPVQQLPPYGPWTSTALSCSLAQGAWSLGYLASLLAAGVGALRPLWQLRRLYGPLVHTWPAQEKQDAVLQCARLALVLSIVLTLLPYAISPVTAEKPWSTRYLMGLLVATPAVLWPLWQGLSMRSRPMLSRLNKGLDMLWRVGALLLLGVLLCLGTVQVFAGVPAAQAEQRQTTALIRGLNQAGIRHIYSDYWTCDNIIFASHEQITCGVLTIENQRLTPGLNRYMPYYAIVRADPRAAYMFPLDQGFQGAFAQTLGSASRQFEQHTFDGYVLYSP